MKVDPLLSVRVTAVVETVETSDDLVESPTVVEIIVLGVVIISIISEVVTGHQVVKTVIIPWVVEVTVDKIIS